MSSERTNQWPEILLRDLIERNYSGPSPTCEERNIGNSDEWGLLKTTAITWSGWNEDAHKVPPKTYWNNPSIEVQPDDVLVTKAGPRHRVGVVVHVRDTRPHLMVSGKMIGLRPRTEKIIPSILASLLSTREPQDFLNSRTTGMAESQTNFADDALLQTPLRVPPLVEQRRIAEVLDILDDQIRTTEQLIAKRSQATRGLIDALLLEHSNAAESALGSHLARIDAGWSPDCPDVVPKEGEWGVVKVSAASAGFFRPRESKVLPKSLAPKPALEVREGDVLCVRANGVGELVGRVAYVEHTPRYLMLSDKILRLVPKAGLNPYYLSTLLTTSPLRRQIESVMGGSSSQKNISQAELRRLRVRIPTRNQQDYVVQMLRANDRNIEAEERLCMKLRDLKQAVMTGLLTGRTRVPVEAGS